MVLGQLRAMKDAGRKFAMLTAYDYPMARAAQDAGVHALLVGDSMGTVLLGHENTRLVPLSLMVTLAEAVRRGAPDVWLVGDMPFAAMSDLDTALDAARRFLDEAGCDAVKFEVQGGQAGWIPQFVKRRIDVIAHLGLRPQSVLTSDGYRAQARDADSIEQLVRDAKEMESDGAVMILLEAVSADAGAAVVEAVDVPVIGCGAGPACDGHVVVTQDMLGLTGERVPRFVPQYADLGETTGQAMRRWVEEIASGAYPGSRHVYGVRKQPTAAG